MELEGISAVTLAVRNMAQSVRFYEAVGFQLLYGGQEADFSSFRVGLGYLNLTVNAEYTHTRWGRMVFYVRDVDASYAHIIAGGLTPETLPQDASWGERYFHLEDPDGHELSFARPL